MAVARERLWESGRDESVEVNQRALIDKVLARYSGEFTVFRELLQNSDDAASKAVEIRFETQRYLDSKKGEDTRAIPNEALDRSNRDRFPDLKTQLVHQWTFRNNGMVFRDEDWSRLKKIAEGNPDEEKIGAFGVGFYSLFSITEEPFVTSGDQWMGFYWKDKKDQLFARRGNLPSETSASTGPQWTAFEMPLREPAPIPPAFDFVRFLASSITFMVQLREISVFLDDWRLARLVKDPGAPITLTIPKGLKPTSPLNIMHIKSIRSNPLHINASVMRCVYTSAAPKATLTSQISKAIKSPNVQQGFFSSIFSSLGSGSTTPARALTPNPVIIKEEVDMTAMIDSNVILSVFSTEVQVKVDKKLALELNRSTKKNPPTSLRLDLIYTGKDEYDASKEEDVRHEGSSGSIFQGLRADLEGVGSSRVYIGHATGQTTGFGGHIAARFIPTVERESIDLVDRNVSIWNKELLYVGGFLARAAYELEMISIRNLWNGALETNAGKKIDALPDPELREWLQNRALHVLNFFTFRPSTPSSTVSEILEVSFFSCATNHPFTVMSTTGVKSGVDVRIPDPAFKIFLKQLPVLPENIMDGAKLMIDVLRARGMVKDITFMDVLAELRARPLNEEELIACVKWWIGIQAKSGQINANLASIRGDLIKATILITDAGTPQEKIVPLELIQTFVNPRTAGSAIIVDGPLPAHTLPLSVSRNFSPDDISSSFGWRELSVVEWIAHITSPVAASSGIEYDLSSSAAWAERVLNSLARAWSSVSQEGQTQIVTILKSITCIPTRSGMKLPQQAYFPNANLFPDLPILAMPKGSPIKGNIERVLQALGVRKHVELQLVFDRMIKTGDWTISDLIKYLVTVQNALTPIEMERLRATSAFPVESTTTEEDGPSSVRERRKAGELYEPLDIFREMKLPVIDWGNKVKWRNTSDEAKFLFQLGLRRYPPLRDLINLAASSDVALRTVAFKYFLDNYSTRYSDYSPAEFADVAFIPAVTSDGKAICASPLKVFIEPESTILGFNVIHPSVREGAADKLKLHKRPPTSLIVPLLQNSAPKTQKDAQQWFEILAGRVADFSHSELQKISHLPIIPAESSTTDDAVNKKQEIEMRAPKDCYFKGETEQNFHSNFFVFVDFGSRANGFLAACGTKREPSVEEVTNIMLANPRQFYRLAGGRENYSMELRNIAVNRRALSSSIRLRMKRADIFLGSRRVKKTKEANTKLPWANENASADLDEDEWDLQHDLMKADQIVVADDTSAYQIFGDALFTSPQEDLLEEFYAEFGSPRLSSLIREDHRTTNEIKDAKVGKEMRALILERLPLFLHEHTHTRPRISYSWLNDEKHFLVKSFGKLTTTQHLHFGAIRLSKNQDSSAIAKRQGSGPVELWIAGHSPVDMYEVSISLCRVLFQVPKVNDALLFMTILSTDLRALRRRGYNVDRILKQQKAERQAAEEARRLELKRREEEERLVSDVPGALPGILPPEIPSSTRPIPTHEEEIEPPTQLPTQSLSKPSVKDDLSLDGSDRKRASRQAANTLANGLSNLRRRFQPHRDGSVAATESGSSRPTSIDIDGPPPHYEASQPLLGPPQDGPNQQRQQRPRTPQTAITPLSDISSNIERAIAMCRQEQGRTVHNKENLRMVKEAMNDSYCDVSGRVGDLDFIGTMADVRIYLSKEVTNDRDILVSRRDSIARFIHVIQPLRAIFKLPPTSLHIFYDTKGETIGFNRNASIFLNLRYYEAWHDGDVQHQDLSKAFISWYYTLAHEIAHNLVEVHSAEHEFWFSAICEEYTVSLGQLLSGK